MPRSNAYRWHALSATETTVKAAKMQQSKNVLKAGVKTLASTKKLVGMKNDPMMNSSLDGHSGYTKQI